MIKKKGQRPIKEHKCPKKKEQRARKEHWPMTPNVMAQLLIHDGH